MSTLTPAEREHLELLLIDLATEGLDPQRRHELDALLERAPDVDPEEYELAAAALDLALQSEHGAQAAPLSGDLQARILANVQGANASVAATPIAPPPPAPAATIHDFEAEKKRRGGALPWGLAAAAALLAIGGVGYFYDQAQTQSQQADQSRLMAEAERNRADGLADTANDLEGEVGSLSNALAATRAQLEDAQRALEDERRRNQDVGERLQLLTAERDALALRESNLVAQLEAERDQLQVADQLIAQLEIELDELQELLIEPTVVEDRARLLSAADSLRIDWTSTDDDWMQGAEAGGEVVWNNRTQSGVMTFSGMPQNDPGEVQYQLWIFDREQQNPIDGGVFDLTADGELAVRIDPKLGVAEPFLFAVTLEKPGGVVVSGREHIVLTAAL
ncbi:MAG: anti-sigma factor [Planctomycetota bacterium]|jgi:hypothetical protein